MDKMMRKYGDADVINRRKRRFRIWLKSVSDIDREVLRVLAVHDLARIDGNKPVKKTEVFNKMLELHEDYLQSACPALTSYYNKKHERKS